MRCCLKRNADQAAHFGLVGASPGTYTPRSPCLRERGISCHSGFFLICAQRRGYFFGVGPVLRMTTAQWRSSVPEMS